MISRRSALKTVAAGAVLATPLASTTVRAARAEAAWPPEGDFVETSLGRVHYLRRGQGPEVVLIHGAGGNLRDFSFSFLDRLAERYTVTAFDRPGLGYTARTAGVEDGAFATEGESPAQQAAMLRAAAAALGIAAPVVVGHSFGAIVAWAWALAGLDAGDRPENAAAVVSLAGVTLPWPGGLDPLYTWGGSALGGAVIVPLLAAFVPASVIEARINATFAPQEAPAGYDAHIGPGLTLRPQSFRANLRQVNTLRPHVVRMEPRYGELTLPAEIVHGTADTTVPIDVHARPMAARHRFARLTELPGIGHMPHHAAPEACAAAIDRAAARAGLR